MTVPRVLRGLLDTSVVIRLERIDPLSLPAEPLISAVTLAELSVAPLVTTDEGERAARQVQLQQAEAAFEPIPFETEAARAFGRVSAAMRRVGRKAQARSLDAMIAATALAHGLPLFTANPADFEGIDGLDVRSVRPE